MYIRIYMSLVMCLIVCLLVGQPLGQGIFVALPKPKGTLWLGALTASIMFTEHCNPSQRVSIIAYVFVTRWSLGYHHWIEHAWERNETYASCLVGVVAISGKIPHKKLGTADSEYFTRVKWELLLVQLIALPWINQDQLESRKSLEKNVYDSFS